MDRKLKFKEKVSFVKNKKNKNIIRKEIGNGIIRDEKKEKLKFFKLTFFVDICS